MGNLSVFCHVWPALRDDLWVVSALYDQQLLSHYCLLCNLLLDRAHLSLLGLRLLRTSRSEGTLDLDFFHNPASSGRHLPRVLGQLHQQ